MAEPDEKDGNYWYWCMIEAGFFGSTDSNDPILSSVLEEFSKLKPAEPKMRFHVEKLKMLSASLDVNSERIKNTEEAKKYRNCGNDLFSSEGGTDKAAEMYTKSIAYALPGSRELALAYANRSAVSFKTGNYEDCLLDIERSLENDYPEEMKAKLYARKVRCLVTLKEPQEDIENALRETEEALSKMDLKANGRDLVEKTLNNENHMAPTATTIKKIRRMKLPEIQDPSCDIPGATGVKMEYSEKYGRHIVATRDIQPTEIIAVTDTYANAQPPEDCYRQCAQCTRPTTASIPCDHCINVIYCSTSCRDKSWKDYHEIECPILGIIFDLGFPTHFIMGIRITLRALQETGSVSKLKELVAKIDSVSDPRLKGFTGTVFDFTKYASIYTLTGHSGKLINDSFAISLASTFAIYYLATRTEIFGQKYDTDLEVFDKSPELGFLGELMIKHCEIAQMTGLGDLEVRLSPFTALCNHSCDPSTMTLVANKSVVFALKPIKAGEQIFDNYMDMHYGLLPKAKRQKKLNYYWQFTCDCVACVEDWPMFEDLPVASLGEISGMSPTTLAILEQLQKILLEKFALIRLNGDMLAPKDELVQLLELLYEHAWPCREVMTIQKTVRSMYESGIDTS